MSATNGQNGFASEVRVFFDVARKVGQLRYDGNRSEFEQTLLALGMDQGEVTTYWDLVDVSSAKNWRPLEYFTIGDVKSNTALSQRLGIELKNGPGQPPRNWLLYRLFSLSFPGVLQVEYKGWQHFQDRDAKVEIDGRRVLNPDHRTLHFEKQPIAPVGMTRKDGNPMSVYRAVQGVEPAKFQGHVMRSAGPLRSVFGDELGLQFAELLLDLQMLIPSETMTRALRAVVEDGKCGKEIVLAGAFCPDYAYVETGNPLVPYQYTFDGLGEGVGLVARQFARIIPGLSRFFAGLGLKHRFVIGIGDFEADSEVVLQRVGVDRQEFIRRCQCSLDAFQSLMPSDISIELELFDVRRGNGNFRVFALECTERMIAGDFGKMPDLHPDLANVIARIPSQYRTFYERWHGVDMDDVTVRKIVFSQGGEYAAVARIYREALGDNVIFLAGDRPEMNRFNAFWAPLPVLCAKRAY
ncbi:MAG: hypothetical protein K8Q97_02385 [Candidatus Andersenbacteria bacterium]|nr:hypothetical protein [Candidatus Andersenbacteria bacterium]